jgi:hypothetical protein
MYPYLVLDMKTHMSKYMNIWGYSTVLEWSLDKSVSETSHTPDYTTKRRERNQE